MLYDEQMPPEERAETCLSYIDEYVDGVQWNTQCHIALVKFNPEDWNDPLDVQFVEHLLFTEETDAEIRVIASYIRRGLEPVGWVEFTPETEDTCFWTKVRLFEEYVNADPDDYIDDVIYEWWVERTGVVEPPEAKQRFEEAWERFEKTWKGSRKTTFIKPDPIDVEDLKQYLRQKGFDLEQ